MKGALTMTDLETLSASANESRDIQQDFSFDAEVGDVDHCAGGMGRSPA
jgi:hypothetical protein